MTDTGRIDWLEKNKCAVGVHINGQWRVIQNAEGGPGIPAANMKISVGESLRKAIDNGVNMGGPPQ